MKKSTVFLLMAILHGLTISGNRRVLAQTFPSCQILETYANGSCLVKIGRDTLLAISAQMAKEQLKMNSDLKAAKQEIALKDSLLEKYGHIKIQYDTTLARQKVYMNELESVLEGYKNLVKDYKKLKSEPWVNFEFGIGATGETKPSLLMGLGVRRFRVYGFLQENNGGVLAGAAFPLF